MLIIQLQEGVCGSIATEEVEMEILMEEEAMEDDEDEFSSEEEEEEATSPKMPVETKRESTGSLGFSKELSSILASKMNTLNDNEGEDISRGDTKKEETNTKETGKFQQRRKPPPPPIKPKVWM